MSADHEPATGPGTGPDALPDLDRDTDLGLADDPRRSRLVRAAAVVGDLDSPFYVEERDRDVWNEASAVGFQVLLWGAPLVAAAALWISGADALPAVGLLIVLWAAAGALVLAYARRFGVDPNARTSPVAGRQALFIAVIGLLGTGLLNAGLDLEAGGSSATASFLRGAGQGASVTAAVLSLVVVALLIRERRRPQERSDGPPPADDRPRDRG